MKRSFPRSIAPANSLLADSPSANPLSGDSLAAHSVPANRVCAVSSERSEWPLDADDFAAYYRFSPAALAVRECLRLRAVRKFDLQPPILDIGCGDGLFATLGYPGKQVWGIDVNLTEIRRAQSSAAYNALICGSITEVTLPAGFFRSAIANCSLEHVPDLDRALRNVQRALAAHAEFIAIVPTPHWTRLLAIPELLRSHGFQGLADAYGRALDKIFYHVHLYDAKEWTRRLENAGYAVRSIETQTSRRSSRVFDALLYPSLVGWLTKKLTGKWVISPALRNLSVDAARTLVNRLAASVEDSDDGSEYLILAEARKD
jgi:SAM-dependent methyltransferase